MTAVGLLFTSSKPTVPAIAAFGRGPAGSVSAIRRFSRSTMLRPTAASARYPATPPIIATRRHATVAVTFTGGTGTPVARRQRCRDSPWPMLLSRLLKGAYMSPQTPAAYHRPNPPPPPPPPADPSPPPSPAR